MPDANDAQAVPLVEVARRTFRVAPPFNPRTTLHKPSHFPSPFELTKPGQYLFVTHVGRHLVGAKATFTDDGDTVTLRLLTPQGVAQPDIGATAAEIARRLGLTLRLLGYQSTWDSDPILSTLPTAMRGARPSSPFSLYEFLIICTLLQNTTVGRTVHMARTLADVLGTRYQFPSGEVLTSFWEPARLVELGEPRLRELKLGYRAKTLVRAAETFAAEPDLDSHLIGNLTDTGLLREQLSRIYGVGPASVGYIMFEWFKTMDEFSHISPWELKILSRLLFNDTLVPAAEMLAFCRDRWAPFTMLAVHAVFESIFWRRANGQGPQWLDELIRL